MSAHTDPTRPKIREVWLTLSALLEPMENLRDCFVDELALIETDLPDGSTQAAAAKKMARRHETARQITVEFLRPLDGRHRLRPGDCGWIKLEDGQDIGILASNEIELTAEQPPGPLAGSGFIVKMATGRVRLYVAGDPATEPRTIGIGVQLHTYSVGVMSVFPGARPINVLVLRPSPEQLKALLEWQPDP